MPLLSPPHPGFFEVLANRRAYTTLLYLLVSMVTGILTFTYAVTGLSLSLGLAILIIGIPVAVAYFTLLVTLLTTGLALLAVPVLRLLHLGASFIGDLGGIAWITAHPGLAVALCGLAGLALLPLTFHLALLLGRFQIWLARHLLVRV